MENKNPTRNKNKQMIAFISCDKKKIIKQQQQIMNAHAVILGSNIGRNKVYFNLYQNNMQLFL